MRVVAAVAGDTGLRHRADVLARRRGERVAGLACNTAMPAFEFVVGALLVVEVPQLPVARVVAPFAALAEAEFVLVVLLVARNARLLQLVVVEVPRVAALALHLSMLAPQRVLGVGVVIERDVGPGLGGVAGLAFLAELALVLVVLLVAGDASERCVLEGAVAVTVFARNRRVLAG